MWGKREIIYLSLHCHHHNHSCIKMGNNENHFNASLIVRNETTTQCPQTITFSKSSEAESSRGPSAYQPNALPLGQTGSQSLGRRVRSYCYVTNTAYLFDTYE